MTSRKYQHIRLERLYGEVIQAYRLFGVPTAVYCFYQELLLLVIVVELCHIRLAIFLLFRFADLCKLLKIQALARSVPVFVNILHVSIEGAELH